VRQHYLDILNRQADQNGMDYWVAQINACGSDPICINRKRVDVSAAFFVENEFQQTGSFVYRAYKVGFGSAPNYAEFLSDRSQLLANANLDASKRAFALSLVQRSNFIARYPARMASTEFVDALITSVKQNSGVDLSTKRSVLAALYDGTDAGRAAIIDNIANDQTLVQSEYNPSFVLMQYFGYLQRDPDAAGLAFWLNVLNNRVAGNYRSMVCAFITSAEYQFRFGPTATHSNRECSQ
jgi:hypothetical protein